MTRYSFGGGAEDYVASNGRPRGGVTVTFWTARLGGTQITDLLDAEGVPAVEVVSDDQGQLPVFYGPDGVSELWADAGGARVRLDTYDTDDLAEDAAADAAAAAVSAAAAAESAAVAAGLEARVTTVEDAYVPAVIAQGQGLAVDGTAALQAKLTEAAGGHLVITGLHRLEGVLVPGGTLPTTIELRAGAEVVQYANTKTIEHLGSADATRAISPAPAVGAVTLTVDTTGLAVGDCVLVSSADVQPSSTRTEGMLRRLVAVGATTVQLDAPLYVALPTTPVLRKINLAPQLTFTGPGVWRQDTPATKTQEQFCVALADAPRWLGVNIRDGGAPAVQVVGCDGGEFSGSVRDLLNDPAGSHYGYAVNLAGPSRNFRVHSGEAVNVRHGFTTGGEGADGELGFTLPGCPEAFHVASSFKVSGGKRDTGSNITAGLDTHAEGWGGWLDANVEGCHFGINDRARRTRISGAVVGAYIGVGVASTATDCWIDRVAVLNLQRNESAGTPYAIRNEGTRTIIDGPYIPTVPSGAVTIGALGGDYTLRGSGDLYGAAAGPVSELFFAAPQLSQVSGSPTLNHHSSFWTAWLLDAAAIEAVGIVVRIPAGWQTYDILVRGANFAAGAGDVVLRTLHSTRADGDNVGTAGGVTGPGNVTVTAGAQNIQQTVTLATGVTANSTRDTIIRVDRMATDAADTLANDYGIGAILLRRAT